MEARCFTSAVKYLLVAGEYSALEYVSDAAMQHYAITGKWSVIQQIMILANNNNHPRATC